MSEGKSGVAATLSRGCRSLENQQSSLSFALLELATIDIKRIPPRVLVIGRCISCPTAYQLLNMLKRKRDIADNQEFESSKTEKSLSTKLMNNDYTVGWICALPKEQTAATAMLDAIHPDLPNPARDTNTYTLGSIGSHNIVIACLPKGRHGTTSAAVAATQMINTFPSIRVGLIVGISSGIPSKVRLRDVVVSTPIDQYPGVVQWDMGKAEGGNGCFKRTGALNNPRSTLLTALSNLETKHDMSGSAIQQYPDDTAERWPE